MSNPRTLVLVSGGLDSVTLAYMLRDEGHDIEMLSVHYGQRHVKELEYADYHANHLEVVRREIDLSDIVLHLPGSSLTSSTPVPDGHYAAENMRSTVVPNRNAMMLAVAYAIAAANGMQYVATAVHAGDLEIYPDCRPEFIQNFARMEDTALEGYWDVGLLTPFLHLTKADIARKAGDLDLDIGRTWSCYKGLARQCGRCGTCCERAEAIALAGLTDPTDYEDPLFWKTVTRIAPHLFPTLT